jgi:hypothetical protein
MGHASRGPIEQSGQCRLEPVFHQQLTMPCCTSRLSPREQRCGARKRARPEELLGVRLGGSRELGIAANPSPGACRTQRVAEHEGE